MEAKNNVIQFPQQKGNDKNHLKIVEAPQAASKAVTLPPQKKWSRYLAIAAIFVGSWIVNSQFNEEETNLASVSDSRMPASANQALAASFAQRDQAWEKAVAKQLAAKSNRYTRRGQTPNLGEQLRFDDLQGQYKVKLIDGKLYEVLLNPEYSQGVNLTIEDFAQKYAELFPFKFSKVERQMAGVEGNSALYVFKDEQNASVGRVTLDLDTQGNLNHLRVLSQ